jgi:hypothetical protein
MIRVNPLNPQALASCPRQPRRVPLTAEELQASKDMASVMVQRLLATILAALSLCGSFAAKAQAARRERAKVSAAPTLSRLNTDLIDDISRRSFRYFWDNTDPNTGLVSDRARTDGKPEDNPNHEQVASIAATGFGLTAFCIAADHRWISREMARQRVLAALHYFYYQAPQEHGWFYHYLDSVTGQRRWNSEVSSIDTALLLAGVLTARDYFRNDPEIVELATGIYNRVDFPWMMDGSHAYFSHGWTPHGGFLRYRWDTYSELMILYVLGIGSPSYPISPATWFSWKLPVEEEGGYAFVGGGPLFIQQYSQAWVDLRDRVPDTPDNGQFVPHVNYFENSVAATRAQQHAFSDLLSQRFPGYSADIWGLTASESSKGYVAWGASAEDPRIDGTVVPSAAAGSLMFAPDICIPALRAMLVRYGKKIYGRYGFADAFNPTTGWVSRYVIGIDVGITLLSAENLRTGKVWHWFMSNPEPERALDLVGLVKKPLQAGFDNSLADPSSTIGDGKNPENNPTIFITPDPVIPASDFEFKIPVSALWTQQASSQSSDSSGNPVHLATPQPHYR